MFSDLLLCHSDQIKSTISVREVVSDYQEFYDKLTYRIRQNPRAVRWVNVMNNSITRVIYVLYPVLIALIWWTAYRQGKSLSEASLMTLPYLVIPAISFVGLSYIRKYLNYPRPYEQWMIETIISKETLGHSMPSRHVFSATIIAMCALHVNLWLGWFLLLMAICLAVLRVIGGVHYPKDVLLGLFIGLLSGALFWLF